MSNGINWCTAVSAAFGPSNAHCALEAGHIGRHFDMRGRGWFNLADALMDDTDSGMDIFEAADDIDRRWGS
jgi:hypothetical protein